MTASIDDYPLSDFEREQYFTSSDDMTIGECENCKKEIAGADDYHEISLDGWRVLLCEDCKQKLDEIEELLDDLAPRLKNTSLKNYLKIYKK